MSGSAVGSAAGGVGGRVAFLEAPSGIAGDMLLGALVDAGVPLATLQAVPAALGLAGVEVRARRVTRGVLAATKVDVLVDGHEEGMAGDGHGHPTHAGPHGHHGHHEHTHQHHERTHAHVAPAHGAPHPDRPHAHRAYAEIAALLEQARGLPHAAVSDARRVFRALAEAEGRVHGVPPEEVRFHEVGAADALVDIVGACVGLHALGVDEVRVGPLPWPRGGTVGSAHGRLPLPAPATAFLLVGHPCVPSEEALELVTPTGAALVRALCRASQVPAGFVPRLVGMGAGTRDGTRMPNVLRLVVGEVQGREAAGDAVLLETNLDDVTGQVLARALERLLAEGALDAWVLPATMKKGRPGQVLCALCAPADAARLEEVLFEETPTLGVRRVPVGRRVLPRHHVEVMTPFGAVRIKVRVAPQGPQGTPEHDDCRRLADQHGVPLRDVLEAALRAWSPTG